MSWDSPITITLLIVAAGLGTLLAPAASSQYYVATDGDDTTGDGSPAAPWATITQALDSVPDGSLVLVRAGIYSGRIRIRGSFTTGVTVRSEIPYRAMLRNNDRVITAYADPSGCSGITIDGFDIAHDGPGAAALVVHVDGGGDGSVHDLVFTNNIMHDSYNNDILKINNSTYNIRVIGNMFYNQTGSDEHIDINSVENVNVEENIFFNDFEGSGRTNTNDTSSYIVIKDSNQDSDMYVGSRNVHIHRNIFLNWEGSTGSNFVLIGEDGNPYFEAFDVLIENNLMLGNADNVMRAALGVKGGRNITFKFNTVSGDLPSLAFAMRLNTEGANPANENIQFISNIWSDPTGSMGATTPTGTDDFSDTPPAETTSFSSWGNVYWNGGDPIPEDPAELINMSDDSTPIVGDPVLLDPIGVVLPRWFPGTGLFGGGYTSIHEAFIHLGREYGSLGSGSSAGYMGHNSENPERDLLGNHRGGGLVDAGAVETFFEVPTMSVRSILICLVMMGVFLVKKRCNMPLNTADSRSVDGVQ